MPHLVSFNLKVLWPMLPTLARIYIFFICVASVYILISLTRIALKLRLLKRSALANNSEKPIRQALAGMQTRLAGLRQFLFFSLLLFGVCFLFLLTTAFITADHSNLPPFWQLVVCAGYGTDVLSVFLLLHLIQWFVASCVQAYALKQLST
jgi:hypothetical protein